MRVETDHSDEYEAARELHEDGLREQMDMGLVERLRNGGQADLADMAEGLLVALQEAIGAVKTFHGPDCWDIYEQHSPEMKRWRAAIAKATRSTT